MKPSALLILALLRQRGDRGLSPNEARLLAGCDRLAARIHELRAEGLDITRQPETCLGATYARYRLHEAPCQLSLLDPLVSASPSGPSRRRAVQDAERHPQPVRAG